MLYHSRHSGYMVELLQHLSRLPCTEQKYSHMLLSPVITAKGVHKLTTPSTKPQPRTLCYLPVEFSSDAAGHYLLTWYSSVAQSWTSTIIHNLTITTKNYADVQFLPCIRTLVLLRCFILCTSAAENSKTLNLTAPSLSELLGFQSENSITQSQCNAGTKSVTRQCVMHEYSQACHWLQHPV